MKQRASSAGGRSWAFALAAALGSGGAWSEQLYKCGANYQDKPCANLELQKRYAAGRFDVEQVNPDTDKDCARRAAGVMPYWMRMHKGESLDALRGEFDAKPVARDEKIATRDLLLSLKSVEGPPMLARSQIESQCMASKKRYGIPTESEIELARSGGGTIGGLPREFSREYSVHRRAELTAERAARAANRAYR